MGRSDCQVSWGFGEPEGSASAGDRSSEMSREAVLLEKIYELLEKVLINTSNRVTSEPIILSKTSGSTENSKFESVWARYPRREGRKEAERHFNASVKSTQDYLDIQNALDNYIRKLQRDHTEPQYVKMGSTWFNNWRDYVNYSGVDAIKPPPPPVKPRPADPRPEDCVSSDDLKGLLSALSGVKRVPK